MDDITTPTATVTPTASAAATGASADATGNAGNVLSSDFETFIRMLTTQAQYQDPLEPIDSSEYAAQLAQFSMVEQQVRTNDSLSQLIGQMSTTSMASLAGWVGMEARAATPMYYSGAPITLSPNPLAIADSVELVVRDEGGATVERKPLPLTSEPYIWTGLDASGTPYPDGIYSFEVESYASGELILSEQSEVYARVTEAQNQGGDVILILEGGAPVSASSVSAIRDPATAPVTVTASQPEPVVETDTVPTAADAPADRV